MYRLLIIIALLACSPKTYTEPEIGMDYMAFHKLCGYEIGDYNSTLTTEKGDTTTLKTISTETRARECVGTFTFFNSKLTAIER